MVMKYAKGKWRISESGNIDFKLCIVAEDGGSICHITNWAEAKANAKLICKVPEMHEALKEAIRHGLIEKDGYESVLSKIHESIKEIES